MNLSLFRAKPTTIIALLSAFLLIFCPANSFLTAESPKFYSIIVDVSDPASAEIVEKSNFDYMEKEAGSAVRIVLNSIEFEKILSVLPDSTVAVLDSNLEKTFSSRLRRFDKIPEIGLSDGFRLGTMGGCFTLEEIYERFEEFVSKYSEFVTGPEIIGKSVEGRDIYAYSIGSVGKPQALITAAHHARECGGVAAATFFVEKLLENAATGDTESLYILSEREIKIVPCVNPDGYFYNEENFREGGGMWRKNRRPNEDESFGVDLNRNYGPEEFWDHPNGGSSEKPYRETYRGTEPFSEPEIRAVRNFCLANNFAVALNYHTYGNYIIYPYGALGRPTPDSLTFRHFSRLLTEFNRYSFGLDAEQLGYGVRGGADDWMYYATEAKSPILSATPELGTSLDGFWPDPPRLLEICRENLRMNYDFVLSSGANLRALECEVGFDEETSLAKISIEVRNYGASRSNNETVRLISLDNRIEIIDGPQSIPPLMPAEYEAMEFSATVDFERFRNGLRVPIEIEISRDVSPCRDTINPWFFAAETVELFAGDSVSAKEKFDLGDWGFEVNASGSAILSDSPYQKYRDSIDNYVTLLEPISLDCRAATFEFVTSWNIESKWDFAVIEISVDGGNNWKRLSTGRTVEGLGLKDSKQPKGSIGLHGNCPIRLRQTIDLEDYIGEIALFRFGVLSDFQKSMDGMKLFEISVNKYPERKIDSIEDITEKIFKVYPNPTAGRIIVELELNAPPLGRSAEINIIDALGNSRLSSEFDIDFAGIHRREIDASGLAPGVYFVEIALPDKLVIEKVEIVR